MNTFNLTLDLNKSRASSPVRLRQGDAQGTTITALVLDHGATADLTGMTAQLVMELPDGTQYYRKTASISGNSVSVLVDETQAASVSGRTANAYFQMLQGTTVKASTGSFAVEILPDALAGATVPESYDSAIQDAIDALDDAVEQMPDMVEDVLTDHPEWTTTVQDGSITAPKLATDLARDRERLMYRLDNLLANTLAEGELASATDAAKTPVAGLSVYGRSTQDGTPTPSAPVSIESVAPDSQGNISLLARGRNLLRTTAGTQTISGVTLTRNEDGTFRASGTSTGTVQLFLVPNNVAFLTLKAGTYTLSGCPAGGGTGTYKLDLSYNDGSALVDFIDFGSRRTFTLAEDTTFVRARIVVYPNTNVDNLTFSPMLEMGTTATAYQPYEQTVSPIDLDGYELRSLPDGTRDELTVDARGHAVLVQRVGHVVLDGSESGWGQKATDTSGKYSYTLVCGLPDGTSLPVGVVSNWTLCDRFPNASDAGLNNGTYTCHTGVSARRTANGEVVFYHEGETLADWKTWLASNPTTLDYKLATPVTHDLGTIDPVPLCGPDLTAQAVPTAPFTLTYERDLNATLARLESAIANLV